MALVINKKDTLLGKTYESKRGSGVIVEVTDSKYYHPTGNAYVVKVEQPNGDNFHATVVITDEEM